MNVPVRIIDRPERRRLSVADFELLVDGRAFVDDGKIELIDGDIYVMNAQWARHGRAKARLWGALIEQLKAIGSDLEVFSEVSVRVADDSMTEPDLILTTYRGDRAIPAETVALLVEISETTRDQDMGRKVGLYGAAGVPEYWVVDLNDSRVFVFQLPQADGYARQSSAPFGKPLISAAVAGLEIDTARLLV